MSQTVFVTGATGFLAKHIVLVLLRRGWNVIGSVRSPAREAALRAALAPHLPQDALESLSLVTLDLTADAGWHNALRGCNALIHTASPFPLTQPDDENALIRPAVDGTLRALKAAKAAGITRVVLTSSTVAILQGNNNRDGEEQDETDWTDPTHPNVNAYARSKTLAERAAWEFAAANGIALTTINPGFILGPPLDAEYGSSVGLVERILKGKDPMMPRYGFPVVDVRDVAEMHVRALERPQTEGRRFAAVAGSFWMAEMGKILKNAYPDRRIPTRTAPDILLRVIAIFDRSLGGILPNLGKLERISNQRARQDMGMDFIPPEDALRAAAAEVMKTGRV